MKSNSHVAIVKSFLRYFLSRFWIVSVSEKNAISLYFGALKNKRSTVFHKLSLRKLRDSLTNESESLTENSLTVKVDKIGFKIPVND